MDWSKCYIWIKVITTNHTTIQFFHLFNEYLSLVTFNDKPLVLFSSYLSLSLSFPSFPGKIDYVLSECLFQLSNRNSTRFCEIDWMCSRHKCDCRNRKRQESFTVSHLFALNVFRFVVCIVCYLNGWDTL